MRKAKIDRVTNETQIALSLDLDGTGKSDVKTGVGFFDHMIDQLAKHALIDIEARVEGDLEIDDHHTVEDFGIALGLALRDAMGDRRGINRYGCFTLVMDDARIQSALDLSGRPHLSWNVAFPSSKIGTFDTELVREFFTAFSMNARMTLHVQQEAGLNAHHIAEAAFKSVARALCTALEANPRVGNAVPSTKGVL